MDRSREGQEAATASSGETWLERYAEIFRQAPVGLLVFDERLRVVEANARALEVLGSAEAVPDLLASASELRDAALTALTDGCPASYEGVLGKGGRRGAIRLVPHRDRSGRTIGGLGVVEAVELTTSAAHTGSLPLEQRLDESEARFRSVVELAPEAIVVSRDRRFLYVNRTAARLLGFRSPEEIVGRAADALLGSDQLRLADARAASRRRGEPGAAIEYDLRRRDGTTIPFEVVSAEIEYEGRPALLTIGRDLTERRNLQAQLVHAERMAAVGTIAAGVAHEINNPLAYAKANLDTVVSRVLPALRAAAGGEAALVARIDEVVEMLEVTREGCDRVRAIVRDLTTLSRDEVADRGPVDVARVIDATVNLLSADLEQRAKLVRDIPPLDPVVGSEAKLGQVFLNLLLNAAQAVPDGGRGTITVRARPAEGSIVVTVQDDGVGIEQAALSRIFDPFFTTKPRGAGTGLGLWVCRSILQSLGGDITAQSGARGATFTVTLKTATPEPVAESPAPPPAVTEDKPRVLVIDDEPAFGPSLAIALTDEMRVATASSGAEGLARFESDGPFDAILCDLMMPGMSGMDVYEALHDKPEVQRRIVFVTGGTFTARAREFLERVPNPRLEKPFDFTELRRAVARVRRSS